MHPHKIVAQILLIFSILNSVLAAPIVRVRGEIPGARGAVAVRVPSGGVVAVLEKRPYPNTPTGTNLPDLIDFSSPEPSPSTSHELQPPTSPQHSEFQSPTGGHPGFRPLTSPEHPEFQSTRPPGPEEVSGPIHVASPKEIYRPVTENKAPSMPAWREKIMTPEKIKATKYIAGAALFTTLYLGLLLPDIFRDDNKHSQS